MTSIVNLVKKSETLKNTEPGKAILTIDANKSGIKELSDALANFPKTIKQALLSESISIDSVDKVIKEFDKLNTSIGAIPKSIVMDDPPEDWKDFCYSDD
jgi:hypothetical protein